jgi:hypothetical protein
VVVAVLLSPATSQAQRVAGAGDDAIPIPRGGLRIVVSGLWNDYGQVFDAQTGQRTRLFAGLNSDSAGVGLVPGLAPTQQALRTLTGQAGYRLSLGSLTADGEVRQSIAPIVIEYGLLRRLSLRAVVPYAESRDLNQLLLNRDGKGANVGVNPAFGSTGATARAANAALLGQIDAARSQLTAELARCTAPTATNCTTIRANGPGAQALLARALDMRTALQQVYGTANRGASPVVPLTSSTAHQAIVGTVAALRSDFSSLGITAIPVNAAPAGATLVMGPGGITRIGTDSSFGIGYATLGNTRRAGMGDIDLSASFLLLDTYAPDPVGRLLTGRRGIRSGLTVGWRFGVAGADRTEDAFDVPIGDGVNAWLVRSTTDVMASKSLWMSATVRATIPRPDPVALGVPTVQSASPFVPYEVVQTTRTLGNRIDLELAPRYAVGEFFGVSGALLHRRWGPDRYAAVEPSTVLTEPLELPGRSLTSAAMGVSFSTLASYARGRSRLALEVLYTHLEPVTAGGIGNVAAVKTDRLELRIYTGFPRR